MQITEPAPVITYTDDNVNFSLAVTYDPNENWRTRFVLGNTIDLSWTSTETPAVDSHTFHSPQGDWRVDVGTADGAIVRWELVVLIGLDFSAWTNLATIKQSRDIAKASLEALDVTWSITVLDELVTFLDEAYADFNGVRGIHSDAP